MKQWVEYLEEHVYHRSLEPDDYIFPSLGSNGTTHPDEHIKHEAVQEMIKRYADLAGIVLGKGNFTTHCYRRGGAQHRFMYAPVGKRWSLAKVRWWGGWAEGEQVTSTTCCQCS
jgi:integrase